MDPQAPYNPEPVKGQPTVRPVHDSHWITIAAMAVFVLLSLAAVAFLYYQNQQLKTMLASYQTQATPTPESPSTDPTANWKTYVNNGFSFRYPQEWQVMTKNKDLVLLDKIDPDQAKFILPDGTSRDASYEIGLDMSADPSGLMIPKDAGKYTVSGIEGFRYQESQTPSSGLTTLVVIRRGTNNFSIFSYSAAANTDTHTKYLNIFDQILSTFKFISPTASPSAKPVACTQEAKLCPDGSSVGRTGPNCEFAPCP